MDKRQPQKNLLDATRSVAGTMGASETSAPEKDLAAKSAIGWGGASILVSKDPLMYPSMRCPELSIPDCTNNTRVAPNAEPRKSGSGMNLCLASIRTTLGQKGLRAANGSRSRRELPLVLVHTVELAMEGKRRCPTGTDIAHAPLEV